MPGAGQLDRRITVERYSVTTNDLNEEVKAWPPGGGSTVGTFWARRRDVSDGERRTEGQLGSWLESRFTLRWSTEAATITAKDRIVHDGATWSIVGAPKEIPEGRRQWIEITARRDAD